MTCCVRPFPVAAIVIPALNSDPMALEDEAKVRGQFEWAKENSTLVGCQGKRECPRNGAFSRDNQYGTLPVFANVHQQRGMTPDCSPGGWENFCASEVTWRLVIWVDGGFGQELGCWGSISIKSLFDTSRCVNKNWASPKIHRLWIESYVWTPWIFGDPRPAVGTVKRSEAYSLSSRVTSWWFHQRLRKRNWSMYVPMCNFWNRHPWDMLSRLRAHGLQVSTCSDPKIESRA